MATLELTPYFRRRLRRLSPHGQQALARALRLLEADPRDARLRTHKLSGPERWAASFGYDARIVFRCAGEVITLLDLGTHDEVY